MNEMTSNTATKSQLLGTKRIIIPDVISEENCDSKLFNSGCGLQISPGSFAIFDWGRKRTGWLLINGYGKANIELAGDLRIFELYDSPLGQKAKFKGDIHPSFCAFQSRDYTVLDGSEMELSKTSNAFRYVRIINRSEKNVTINSIKLKPSEFPALPAGSFECDCDIINSGWQMGIDTVHLCTQPGDQSNVPVFAPFGDGYVQWDGCRRDREIWGGDLRPSALAWYYNFEDQSPIANSLYAIMNAQHCGCNEHGLFPGSGSTHQTFYEWAFWEVTCLWEYILHTGDEKLLKFASFSLPWFLDWCEKKTSEYADGWIRSKNCWMYTLKFEEQALPSLQAAALIGLEAMKNIFCLLEMDQNITRTQKLIARIRNNYQKSFWDKDLQSYKFLTIGSSHSDLCANAWAILSDLVAPDNRKNLLETIKKLHWTRAGSLNIAPAMENSSFHNNTVWPYANAYEMSARLHCGDTENALELFKTYIKKIQSAGHNTLFEMINIDGSLPIDEKDGNTLSFSHCWASQGSWALQKYLLGVAPEKIGWKKFSFSPLECKLKHLKGSVVTPMGMIDIEIDRSTKTSAKISYPKELECINNSSIANIEMKAR